MPVEACERRCGSPQAERADEMAVVLRDFAAAQAAAAAKAAEAWQSLLPACSAEGSGAGADV